MDKSKPIQQLWLKLCTGLTLPTNLQSTVLTRWETELFSRLPLTKHLDNEEIESTATACLLCYYVIFFQGELTSSDHTVALRLLAYYVILFPSVDVVSAYPLMTHTVVNNVYIIIVGRDTSIQPPSEKKWRDFILRISLRLVIAIIPILAAFGVANLVYVLKYAGLMGFNVCFFFPTMLQLRSIYVCQRTFAPNRISISDGGTLHEKEERQSLLTVSSSAPLSVQRVKGKKQSSQYMTPFSSRVFSHPVAVVTVGVLGVCFFLLTLASLAVKPVKVTCDSV